MKQSRVELLTLYERNQKTLLGRCKHSKGLCKRCQVLWADSITDQAFLRHKLLRMPIEPLTNPTPPPQRRIKGHRY